jgi:hypothetical protein
MQIVAFALLAHWIDHVVPILPQLESNEIKEGTRAIWLMPPAASAGAIPSIIVVGRTTMEIVHRFHNFVQQFIGHLFGRLKNVNFLKWELN